MDSLRLHASSTLLTDVIVVCESHLNSTISDNIVHIDGFDLFRCDRIGKTGGGVCVWVKLSQKFRILYSENIPRSIECIWLHLEKFNCILCCLYLPPGLAVGVQTDIKNYIIDSADSFCLANHCNRIVICGDLNPNTFDISALLTHLNLRNVVSEVTRPSSASTLDLFLIPEWDADMLVAEVGPPLFADSTSSNKDSDHCTVSLRCKQPSIDHGTAHQQRTYTIYDLRKANITHFENELIRLGFTALYESDDPDIKCDLFYATMKEAMQTIPKKVVMMSKHDKPWMNPVLKDIITRRWNAYRQRNWPLFNHLKHKVRLMIEHAKKSWSNKQTSSAYGIWNVVHETLGTGKRKDWLSQISDTDINNTRDKLNEINECLTSVFHKPNSTTDHRSTFSSDTDFDSDWCNSVDDYDIYLALSTIRHKASGSDDIPTKLYYEARLLLCAPICSIINSCLTKCKFPKAWKKAYISPIPKSNPPSIDRLRPISLLPIPSKILERIVLKHFSDKLTACYGENQLAYRERSSTCCALILLHDIISRHLDSKNTAAVVLLSWDYTQAFDCIDHSMLLKKLKEHNFPIEFISFIADYITDRYQAVKYGNIISEYLPVSSGVPQGSVLGPALFCVFVSSLQSLVELTDMLKYADDLQTISLIRKNYINSDIQKVTSCINQVKQWSQDNGLTLNTKKTNAIIFKRSKSALFTMKDIDSTIREVDVLKILGVYFNNSLTWLNHVNDVVTSCSRRLHAIRLLRHQLSSDDLQKVYNAMVLSKIEYCAPLFISTAAWAEVKLKRIQQRFHKIKCGHNYNVCECLASLKDRRIKLATKLWKKITPGHPLYHLMPTVLKFSGKFNIECVNTDRRARAFMPHMAIYMNN
jgi:hypothetical protein